jgi:Uma2 family endonuclease
MVRPASVEDVFFWEGPSAEHQLVVRNLVVTLMKHCPRDLEVVPGPLTVWPFNEQLVQPDVIVVKRSSLQPRVGCRNATPPVLIVEVIDDRSRDWDRQLKPLLYAKTGIDHYWHLDPSVPEFVAYRMSKDSYKYEQVVTARGDERVGFDTPVLVEICPARLAKA